MGFELHQRVRVTDRQSPFYNYIGTVEQVNAEEHRFTIDARYKGWSATPVYATFSGDQLESEGRSKID